MDVILILAAATVSLVFLLVRIWRKRIRIFSAVQGTSEVVFQNFQAADKRRAIENVQWVREDEVKEIPGDTPPVPPDNHDTSSESRIEGDLTQ